MSDDAQGHKANKWEIPSDIGGNANNLSTCMGATMSTESVYLILADFGFFMKYNISILTYKKSTPHDSIFAELS